MWWICCIALQALFVYTGIRREQKAGMWSWPLFLFALAFAGVEVLVFILPMTWADTHRHYFVPVIIATVAIDIANFVWFIRTIRRWASPGGRANLPAYRNEHRS